MSELIYFADLTHTGSIINADVFPIGIGSVAAYAKKMFGDNLECEIFKFPEELNDALRRRTPTVLCLSNYAWNANLAMAFANHIKEGHPEVVVVMGGPNISMTQQGREEFLRMHSAIDFYITFEGERAFAELNKLLIAHNYDASAIREKRIPLNNCLYLAGGEFVEGVEQRIVDLMDLPSPYLTGLFDKFFLQGLRPVIETVRGCPYSCTICNASHPHRNKITRRIPDFIRKELEYIANHVQYPTDLINADDNFGMYREDLETARIIRAIIDKHQWPKKIRGSVGKSHPERVLKAVHTINDGRGVLNFGASIQSADPGVLTAIRRKNLPLATILPKLRAASENEDTEFFTEVILALPEDSVEKHLTSLREGIDRMGMDILNVHQLILLQGTPMALEEQRGKYDFETRYRIYVGCIGMYRIGDQEKPVAEFEEIVIGNSTMNYEEWIECRIVSLLVKIYIDRDGFIEVFGLLRRLGLSCLDVLLHLREHFINKYPKLSEIIELFVHKTNEPLHESLEELIQFTSSRKVVEKFATGELGGNELMIHRAKANLQCYDELHEALRDATLFYLNEHGFLDDEMAQYIEQAVEFSKLRKFNMDNYERDLEGRFCYDFITTSKKGFQVLPREVKITTARVRFFFEEQAKTELDYTIKQWVERQGSRSATEQDGRLQADSSSGLEEGAQLEFNLGKFFHLTNWKVLKRTAQFVE
ncbi:cobalamin-dependent protein [Chloroflexota bacterium]